MLSDIRSPVSESGRNIRPFSNKPKGKEKRSSSKRGSTMKNFNKQPNALNQAGARQRSYDRRIKKTKTIEKRDDKLNTSKLADKKSNRLNCKNCGPLRKSQLNYSSYDNQREQ